MSNTKSITELSSCPKVSIIIPSLNGLELLKISIPSLLKTQYPHFEIIVVDNGSSDNSASFLSKEYPSISVVEIKEKIGTTNAYNVGLYTANGELVSFLNNDMEVDPNWLLPLVLAMNRDKYVAACDSKYLNYFERKKIDHSGGAGRFIDKFGNSISRGGGEEDKGQFNTQEEVFYGLSLFRRDLVIKVGGFDASFFAYYEETDLSWRLHNFGYKTLFVPESKIYHMGSATTSIKDPAKQSNPKKKTFIFHFYKNRLRMLIKNQSGFQLIFSVAICLFDYCGLCFLWLLTGKSDYIPTILKALIWNLINLNDTFKNRFKRKKNSSDLNGILLPYSGVWKTRGSIVS
jgi:GT2 family glycosyltransferase